MGIDAKMLVKTTADIDATAVKKMAHKLASAFYHDSFWILKTATFCEPHHCLSLVNEYEQDGDTIYPADGEKFIEVHIATRYYGVGYERGDLPLIISVANWLDYNIPESSIWYGGDSSGVCAAPFGKSERDALWEHFCSVGHTPYIGAFGGTSKNPMCDFCAEKMIQYGFGG